LSEPVKKPVLVFFHPGAFYVFSGQSSYFGPQYLLDKDIVLVTVNNRMGSLGKSSTIMFLIVSNTGDKKLLKEIRKKIQNNILSLTIKKNIHIFPSRKNYVYLFQAF